MKLLLSFLLCLCISLPLSARAENVRAVAAVFPVWLLLQEVTRGIPGLEAGLLLPSGTGCPHDYAMTPSDRRALAQADVLVINGLGLEQFLGSPEKLRENMKKGAAVIDCSRGIDGILHEEKHGDEHENKHGDKEHAEHHARSANPHIFASPAMAARMVRSMEEQLCALLPEKAAALRANAARARKRLELLALECSQSRLQGRRVAALHSVFDYLARDCALVMTAHIQPHEGQEPSARDMLALLKHMRGENTEAVLVEPQYPPGAGRTLAEEAGIPCFSLDPAAHGPGDASLDYYENVMRANLRELERYLGRR